MPFSSRTLFGAALLLAALALAHASAEEAQPARVVTDGKSISIEYTLKLADGSVADSNVGKAALIYVQGMSQILPALEKELLGMKVGESKQVSLTPAEGYGEINAALFQTVPASAIPEDSRTAGTQLVAQSPSGQPIPVRVHEVKGDEIVMDHNHPLAGQALEFDIKVLEIE